VLLKRSKAEGGGWIVITAGWAFAVMAGAFTAIGMRQQRRTFESCSDAGMAMRSGNFHSVLPYLSAQLLGALAGALWFGCITCRIGAKQMTSS